MILAMLLPLPGKIQAIVKVASAFENYIENNINCPNRLVVSVFTRPENLSVTRDARLAAYRSFDNLKAKRTQANGLLKFAFDTRHVDQETQRNPRENLQYWHRTNDFISSDDEGKLNIFAKLYNVLKEIKGSFEVEPEWHNSYARILHDQVYRILRLEQNDLDIFKPQLNYLEQLIYTRYRLSLDELVSMSDMDIGARILCKDEALLKRGEYLKRTQLESRGNQKQIVIDGNSGANDLVKALFDVNRKTGEKTIERTVTITIRDSVIE